MQNEGATMSLLYGTTSRLYFTFQKEKSTTFNLNLMIVWCHSYYIPPLYDYVSRYSVTKIVT